MVILEIDNFSFTYSDDPQKVRILENVDLKVDQGECIGITGESGSGKTTLALNVMRLAEGNVEGTIRFKGNDLFDLGQKELESLRWQKIAMSFQNPAEALNPVYTVSEQVAEPLISHGFMPEKEAKKHAEKLLTGFGVERPDAFPHQMSAGQQQKALLAMSVVCNPELLIVDEPTSNLDPLSKIEIIQRLKELKEEKTLLLISHDISGIAKLCDKVAVLYGGRVLEYGSTEQVLNDPRHPYTYALINSYPTMTTAKNLVDIRGSFNRTHCQNMCNFYDRCTQSLELCKQKRPELHEIEPGVHVACHLGGIQTLLSGNEIRKVYINRRGLKKESVRALDGVSLSIKEGEVVGLIGETGSGKTTLGMILSGLLKPDDGEIIFQQRLLRDLIREEPKETRRRLQMIYQNPSQAINPRLKVKNVIREPLVIQGLLDGEAPFSRVREALAEVGLPSDAGFMDKYAYQLSGGELNRLALARALVLDPKLIVADEPTSNLDASLQARYILKLKEIQKERGLGLLLITHNLALARKICDRLVVMLRGMVVEEGSSNEIISNPLHPYTKALINAAPTLNSELPSPGEFLGNRRQSTDEGCPFLDRCPNPLVECRKHRPGLRGRSHHRVACFSYKLGKN